MDTSAETPRRDSRSEPAINAPWTVATLIVVLVAAHALRMALGIGPDLFALTSFDLAKGKVAGVITYQFVHGSWAHVLMNSAFVLAFGAPVARYLGAGGRGAAAFLGFFLVCGALAAGGYALLAGLVARLGHGQAIWALVGASGAASGLMGGAARLMEGRGRLGSMFGRVASGMTLSWIVVNVILGVTGLTPGAAGAPVAWEAHIFGYFAGLVLIGPFGRLAGIGRDHAIAL